MADIRIEKRKPIWPWLLGLLGLALVIWLVAEGIEEADEIDDDAYGEVYEDGYEEPVRGAYVAGETAVWDYETNELNDLNSYLTYTNDMSGEMSLSHEFSHEALTRLATATMTLAQATEVNDAMTAQRVEKVKQLADQITNDPMAGTHANSIKEAAMNISEILAEVQRVRYPQYANYAQQVRQEAQAIDPSTFTLNQREDIRSFHSAARNAIAAMSGMNEEVEAIN